MNQTLHNDLENLEHLLQATLSQGVDYLQQLNELPTSVNQSITDQLPLPLTSSGGTSTLAEFISRYEKLMVASAGPRYWGFVTGGTTPAAIMGDILATIYDQNTQTAKGHGDLSGVIELETINMLLELFELPTDTFLGGFVTGATMSNFTSLGVARQWIGKELGFDAAKEGIQQLIKVLAAVPHSSSIKALAMLGLGSSNISLVNSIDPSRESMDVAALESQIEQLNGAPFILISSGGTVNTVDYDDMQAIAQLKKKYNFWWHIDAAFGGFAVLSQQHKHLLKGWEFADSITIDGHKWLNVPYESAFFFTRKEHAKLQIETFQNSNAPYLGDPMENFNFLNFLPENSRRFKALATWFTLKAYGKSGYEEIVTRNIAQAQRLGKFIDSTNEFRLLAPTRLNTVCFTLNEALSDKLDAFLDLLNGRGKVFMTPTVFNKTKGIRAALVNWRTTDQDVELVEKELLEVINLI